jgi:hypothetical protein
VSTLHIVPHLKDKQVTHIELKTDLRSPKFALLVTEPDRPGTVNRLTRSTKLQFLSKFVLSSKYS